MNSLSALINRAWWVWRGSICVCVWVGGLAMWRWASRPAPSDFQPSNQTLRNVFGFFVSDCLSSSCLYGAATVCVTESDFSREGACDASEKKRRHLEGQTNGKNNLKLQTEESKVTASLRKMSPQPCGPGRPLVATVRTGRKSSNAATRPIKKRRSG